MKTGTVTTHSIKGKEKKYKDNGGRGSPSILSEEESVNKFSGGVTGRSQRRLTLSRGGDLVWEKRGGTARPSLL